MKRLLVAVFCSMGAAPAAAEDFYHDFRKSPWRDSFAPYQVKEPATVNDEPEGLRITIPETWIHPYGGAGVVTTFGVQGDFQITTTYELLNAEAPPKGYGVGLTMRIQKAEPSKELANIARIVRPKGRQIVLWSRVLQPPGEQPKYPEGGKPCADKIGRLRLKRTGTTLHFLAAPGMEGEEFEEFHQEEFGADDIRRIFLVAVTGREPVNVDVRFIDLRIESGAMNRVAVQAPAADPERPQNYWWLIPAGAVAAGLLALGLVRRRKGATSQFDAARSPSDAPTAIPAATLEVQCPSCQKRLKVSAAAAGKKVKCPACATAFVS